MTLEDKIAEYRSNYEVLAVVDLDGWHEQEHYNKVSWLLRQIKPLYRECFENNQRLIFTMSQGDEYSSGDSQQGRIVSMLSKILNDVDISNFFIVLLTNDKDNIEIIREILQKNSQDTIPITVDVFDSDIVLEKKINSRTPSSYTYSSVTPNEIGLDELSSREKFLLTESKTFCMYPWVHLHLYPTGDAKPCCMAEHKFVNPLGNANKTSLREIWNSQGMKTLRQNMLNETPSAECTRCYEKEASGFFSGRRSANKHYGHKIAMVNETQNDGHLDRFEMSYWDLRFSNLCNLRCRSCGHMFSSQWYQDQVALAGPGYAKNNKPLFYAGRHETDIWEQLLEHIDYVEQIYFAGGEPLIMDEHYRILEELERREMWHVRLIYNTNFTQVKLKDRYVFDYWRKFDSVAVGASLDAMGPRAEYIRKGTVWNTVEDNRQRMLDTCPEVDFYISPTVSILNALHVPDFHQDWVERGLLCHQDLNVNLLQDPAYLRVDIATTELKQRIQTRVEQHIEWLKPHDRLQRATEGFQSLIKFMNTTDNQALIEQFWSNTNQLDQIRGENLLDIIPELAILK